MNEIKVMLRTDTERLAHIEKSIASFRRRKISDTENVLHLQARIDQLAIEVSRIKQRLDIID